MAVWLVLWITLIVVSPPPPYRLLLTSHHFSYRNPTVMAGDQLVHSGYLQALTCLALGLRLDRVLCYTDTPVYHPQPSRGEGRSDRLGGLSGDNEGKVGKSYVPVISCNYNDASVPHDKCRRLPSCCCC